VAAPAMTQAAPTMDTLTRMMVEGFERLTDDHKLKVVQRVRGGLPLCAAPAVTSRSASDQPKEKTA
jgi:hypothetical protein